MGEVEIKNKILNYIKNLTTGISCEQLINVVMDDFEDNPFNRKEIRAIIITLINHPHIEMKFGYIYWRE